MPIASLDAVTIYGLSNTDPNYIRVTADMASATWNTDATHEILTVTGLVRVKIIAECTESLVGVGATISLGTETTADAWIADTTAADIDVGQLWYDAAAHVTNVNTATALVDKVVIGVDIGYEIDTAALTDGTMVFHVWWEPISAGSAVVAGAGGALA
jgi:hypothetical protein